MTTTPTTPSPEESTRRASTAKLAYHVVQWDSIHETAESRKYKFLAWYAKPNKQGGLGYRQMTRQAEPEALYGAWAAILDVASMGPRGQRGWLLRNGEPLGAEQLALMTDLAQELFDRALKFFASPPVRWLELIEVPGHVLELSPSIPGGSPGVPGRPPSIPGGSPRTDRQTDIQTDRQRTEREIGGAFRESDVAASRTQAGALLAQIREFEARKDELSGEERSELRKKRAALKELQKKQATGDFSVASKRVEAAA